MKRKLYIPNKGISIDFGESKIYTIDDGIYKEFKDNISLTTRRQKKKRLIYLEQFEELKKYYPQIKYFIEPIINLYIKGYVMENVDTKNLCAYSLSPQKRVILLKQIKEILKTFRNIGLMYYDLHLGNVVYNKNNGLPIFFDIDSILFEDENKPDINPQGFDYYKCYGGKLDIKFQRIKFNILAKDILSSCQELSFDEVGQEMIDYQLDVYNPNNIFAHEELIDHVLTK